MRLDRQRWPAHEDSPCHHATEIDAAYAVYDEHPLEEPDAWGDLASFREEAAAS
jgi:hypothetical protein